jgi:hypothetical protein|tara:strand:- start:72 stop:365 length:294 start_codon:yes stop_codon:yes gene_type:complete
MGTHQKSEGLLMKPSSAEVVAARSRSKAGLAGIRPFSPMSAPFCCQAARKATAYTAASDRRIACLAVQNDCPTPALGVSLGNLGSSLVKSSVSEVSD